MKKAGQENVHHLFQCLYWYGIRHVFVCPGSRNAPLINAAVAQQGFELHSVVDERAAGYMALGAAKISQKPAIIICTSGTALLNLFPAVAEAHQLNIPLIVFSADRPTRLINRWENQAIDQRRVFGKYTNAYIEWKGIMELQRSLGKVERIANKINSRTQFPDKGVVHLNFHFSEPLYFPEPIKKVKPFSLTTEVKSHSQVQLPANKSLCGKTLMVLCGTGDFNINTEQEIKNLAEKNALILCDLTSAYRQYQSNDYWELFCNSISEEFWQKNKPDTLITCGSFLLNKNLKNLIRKYPPAHHIHLADRDIIRDTYFSNPIVCSSLGSPCIDSIQDNKDFKHLWTEQMSEHTIRLHSKIENTVDINDLWAIDSFLKIIPKNAILHVANSMSVRYVAVCGADSQLNIYANRGTSGIDGCLSTAVGAALADKVHEHYLICGDLAFFYDANGLWLDKMPNNLKILLLNNQGGNIFDMIPGPSGSQAKSFFTTPHSRTAKNIADDFQLQYAVAHSKNTFTQHLSDFITINSNFILEVITHPEQNQAMWHNVKQ